MQKQSNFEQKLLVSSKIHVKFPTNLGMFLAKIAKFQTDAVYVFVYKRIVTLSMIMKCQIFQVFMTEIGGRALNALCSDDYGRVAKRRKRHFELPNMEMISEVNMDSWYMEVIMRVCPNLKVIKAKNAKNALNGSDESWLNVLGDRPNKIEEVSVSESDFKHQTLTKMLLSEKNGHRLTRLDLRELQFMKLSWLQSIKRNCQSLVRLVIGKY